MSAAGLGAGLGMRRRGRAGLASRPRSSLQARPLGAGPPPPADHPRALTRRAHSIPPSRTGGLLPWRSTDWRPGLASGVLMPCPGVRHPATAAASAFGVHATAAAASSAPSQEKRGPPKQASMGATPPAMVLATTDLDVAPPTTLERRQERMTAAAS